MQDFDSESIDQQLSRLASFYRGETRPSPAETREALRAAVTHIYGDAPSTVPQRLLIVQSLMKHIWGEKASQSAVRLAAEKSSARSADRLDEEQWMSFLSQLRSIVSSICGEAVGSLVWESGLGY